MIIFFPIFFFPWERQWAWPAGGPGASRGEGTVAEGSGRQSLPSGRGSHWCGFSTLAPAPLLPLPAMQGTEEINHGWGEFIAMGSCLCFSLKPQHMLDIEILRLEVCRECEADARQIQRENAKIVGIALIPPPFYCLCAVKVSEQAYKRLSLCKENLSWF